jgi:hypothetical protein
MVTVSIEGYSKTARYSVAVQAESKGLFVEDCAA